jgi:hypothetical protein
MRKMTMIPAFVTAGLFFLALAACTMDPAANTSATTTSSTSTTYQLQKVPRAISVQVPKSLVQSGSTAKALAASREATSRASGFQVGGLAFGDGMSARYWIKEGIWKSQKRLARAAWTLVLVDKAIVDGSLAPSSSTVPASTITWTQAMVDAYTALIPASFAKNADFDRALTLPVAGDTSELPAFVYDVVPASDTVNAASYAFQVTIVKAADGESTGSEETRTFYWSTDRSRFKFAHQEFDGSAVPVEQSFVAYDSTALSMASGSVGEHGTIQVEIKADATATATNGAFLFFDATFASGDAETGLSAGGSVAISAHGYADDSGGTLTSTITVTASGGTVSVYYLKEGFNPAGDLTYLATSPDGLTWTEVASLTTDSTVVADYAGKSGDVEVQHGQLGSSGNAVSGEFTKHASEWKATSGPLLVEIQNAGIKAGVWVASADSFTTVIGTGTAHEAGEVKIAFTSVPSGAYKIAPVDSAGLAIAASAISLTF